MTIHTFSPPNLTKLFIETEQEDDFLVEFHQAHGRSPRNKGELIRWVTEWSKFLGVVMALDEPPGWKVAHLGELGST